jgi:uncharacterized membrane protein
MRALIILAIACVPTIAQSKDTPSLWCTFTEPFANIMTWPGHLRATHETTITTSRFTVGGTDSQPVVQTRLDGTPTTLAVRTGAGSDGMSDLSYPYTGILTGWMMGETPLQGGCVRFPGGSVPRQIVSLGQNIRTNVRASPSPRARLIGSLEANDQVWVLTDQPTKSWTRIAYAFMPRAETGTVVILQGWVQSRHIGPLKAR